MFFRISRLALLTVKDILISVNIIAYLPNEISELFVFHVRNC